MDDEATTIPEILRIRAEINSDLKCFNFYDRYGLVSIMTPKEIYTLSGKFAHLLKSWGFQPGDVIANSLPNSPERIVTDFGIIMAGCILTNCQILEKDSESFCFAASKLCQFSAIVISAKSKNLTSQFFAPYLSTNNKTEMAHDVTISMAPSIQKLIVCDRNHQQLPHNSLMDTLRKMNDKQYFEHDCLPSDLAFLRSTSGSSGLNKLVPATHKQVLDHGRSYKSSPHLIYFNDKPMGWTGGFPYDFLCSGTRRVLQDYCNDQQTQSPSILWNILTSTQCMGAVFSPCDLYQIMDHFQYNPPDYKLPFIAAGGQPIKKDFTKALGMLCNCMRMSYGSTEASVVAVDSVEDHNTFEDCYCGIVKNDVDIKIVDLQGNNMKHGMKGEIYLKGARVMKGYYSSSDNNVSERSGIFTKDGWYKTGDWGMLGEGRKLYCYGRKADVVSIDSTLVYHYHLSWPESILSKSPFIKACSIVGIQTGKGTAILCAFVVSKPGSHLTENNVIDFFDSQIVDTEYKNKMRLSYVDICETLPFLPNGKINNRVLKRIASEKINTRS